MLLKSKALIGIFVVAVIFLMSSVISFAGNITYTYDDLGRLKKVDYGNGVVKEYKYDDAGNRVELVSAQKISVAPSSKDFGSINVGSSSTPQTFTISNTGTADLHISSMILSDVTNYSLNVNGGSSPCGNTTPTIAPDSSCTVAVTFNPSSTGQKPASLTLNSDDPDIPTLNLTLSGTGIVHAVTCSFTPNGTTLIRGGTLRFWASASNDSDMSQTFQFATFVTLPNGHRHPTAGWLFGPIPVTLGPHTSKSKSLTQFIPYNAPFGTYTYHGYVGTVSPPLLYNQCQFNFEVVR